MVILLIHQVVRSLDMNDENKGNASHDQQDGNEEGKAQAETAAQTGRELTR